MQLRLPWTAPPSAPAREIAVDGRTFPVDIARHRRARRYVLRLTPAGVLRLTVPHRASIAGGLTFAARQTDWIRREWERQQRRAQPWTAGTSVWWRGRREVLSVRADAITCGDQLVPIPSCATSSPLRDLVEQQFRAVAVRELPARLQDFAAAGGWRVARVSVRNQRSRWGACSSRAHITLNWRLVQMPDAVRDYVLIHELTHLAHPHHRPSFWRAVAASCPAWREVERWLRKYGKELI